VGRLKLQSEAAREQMFSRRALFVAATQAGAGLLLAGRMTYLSIHEREKYTLLAEDNRVSIRIIPPRRGWIVDRNGKPLAINRPDYRLEIIPEQIADLDRTLTGLSQLLRLPTSELDRIRKAIETQPAYLPVEVASNIPWQDFAAINVRLPEYGGVQPVRGFTRYYPDGEATGHLLGYVGAPSREQYIESGRDPLYLHPQFKVGKDGIEKMLDEPLRGKSGARRVEVNARGRVIRELSTVRDTPGEIVKLTIDRDLQAYAARRIGPESGSVVVIDVWTGDLLTLVSMPSFDPNAFSDGISHTEWNALLANDHNPLINKTVQGLYPPGSTFKPVSALAFLKAGIKPEDSVFCSGRYMLGNHAFHCWKRGGHGQVNMARGIYQSCDTYFYHFSRQVGIDRIAEMARRFGFGQEFEGLSVPIQREGIIPDQEWKRRRYHKDWMPGETLNASIGQGYTIASPLQLAVMAARIAGGRKIGPKLVADRPHAVPAHLDIPEENLAFVRQAMSDVVNAPVGTAGRTRLPIPDVQMAAKTGTAQVRRITAAERAHGVISNDQLPWKFRDHALFVAFAPVTAPRYAIAVVVEHGGGGGAVAGPIARDVMTFLFDPAAAMKSLTRLEQEWNVAPISADITLPRTAAPTAPPSTPTAPPAARNAQQRASRPA
jgi:penicillin-binding protein 2